MKHLTLKKSAPMLGRKNPLVSLQTGLNKVVQDLQYWLEPFDFSGEKFENLVITPAVDIVDDKDQFKVEIEMPGMGEEDIKLSISDGLLIVKGEKTTSTKDKDKDYMMREIYYGSYERRIPLPDSVDIDKAKASFKKGMLWVDIPKKPENVKETRVLEIQRVSK